MGLRVDNKEVSKLAETDLSFLFKTTKHAIKQPRIQSDLNEEIKTQRLLDSIYEC